LKESLAADPFLDTYQFIKRKNNHSFHYYSIFQHTFAIDALYRKSCITIFNERHPGEIGKVSVFPGRFCQVLRLKALEDKKTWICDNKADGF
jgi:hypothetical protein